MGVQGLWQLLQPTGRPISLQSLEGKVLAVDVSIWLHQAVKGMRDKDGSPLPNAHLHVLFSRVCKLLYYKIKPVFVFDGKVPELKKQTMASRRERKMMAEVEGDKTSKKLLDNLLKSHALKEVINKGHASAASSTSSSLPSTSSQSQDSSKKRDLFQLPPLPEEFVRAQEIQPWDVPTTNATIFEDEYQNLDDIDLDSTEFKSLPAEVQHEILSELKERRKRLTRYTNLELPEDSDDFSSFQMAKILRQSHLTNKIEEVRKEMTNQVSGEITQDLGEHTAGAEIQAQRILSDDSSHFILIKGLSNKRKIEELNRIKDEKEKEEDMEKESQTEAEGEFPEKNEVVDLVESDSEKTVEVIQTKHKEYDTLRNESESPIVVDEPKEDYGDTLGRKTTLPIKQLCDSYQENDLILEGSSSNKILQEDGEEFENREVTASDQSFSREVNLVDEDLNKSELRESKSSEEQRLGKPLLGTVNDRPSQQNESSESEDEGFIEVSFDPRKLGPDELFPADIFTTSSTQYKEPLTFTPNSEKQTLTEQVQPTAPEHVVESDHSESSEPEHTEPIHVEPGPTKTSSEAPRDLVRQFAQLVESDVDKVSEDLMLETRALQQERGRQERLATSLSDQMYLEAQDLLKLFGVPYIVSPTEAEAQCAWLDFVNLTNGTITDDSDVWLFGGKRVYKNFFNQDRTVELYLKESIQSQLGLNRDILINMALLCGSDYTEGIPGVGPVTAMEILSEFPAVDSSSLHAFRYWWEESQKNKRNPNFSKVRSKLRHLELSEGFPDLRIVDAYLKPTVDDSEESFSWALPDLDLLREYAKEKLGWTKVKTDELLLPVLQKLKETQIQTRINSYFQPENFMEPKKLKSVRLKRALKKFNDSPEKKSGSKEESECFDKMMGCDQEATKRTRLANHLAPKQSTEDRSKPKPVQGRTSKGARGRGRGRGKGKAPAKKAQTQRKPVYKTEVSLSESSSDEEGNDMADEDDDMLANIDYESWQK